MTARLWRAGSRLVHAVLRAEGYQTTSGPDGSLVLVCLTCGSRLRTAKEYADHRCD